MGYVQASKLGSELLFNVIGTAYERTSVIVTTNPPFEQWPEVFGSEGLTGAVLDRLTHHCQILKSSGESYRLKDARRRAGSKRVSAQRAMGGAVEGLQKSAEATQQSQENRHL